MSEARAHHLALLSEVRRLEAKVREVSARAKPKFEERGALLPRERLALLVDRGAPLLELSTLAGYRMHDDDGEENIAGGSIITAIGFVAGCACVISVSDSGIKGGATAPMGLKKQLRAQEIAWQNNLPLVNLIESAGANLLYQSEIFIDGGKVFRNLARLSAKGLPIVTVVHGSSTAGGAYLPGMSDYVVMVRGASKVFLGGPPLVEAATGERATDEELGGAELHASVTGTAEYLAEDDVQAIEVARGVVARLAHRFASSRGAEVSAPLGDELLEVLPTDPKKPYDAREVIRRLVDEGRFAEMKPLYGAATVCAHASIEGEPVGIIANNGPIDPQGATKAAQFIQLACQSGTALVYLQNTTGYLIGRDAEHDGMVKHGSKMIQAVANATVPQLTLVIGGSYGAGNYGMCGRAFEPRFIFAWPNSRTAVMGGEQAARVMSIITEQKLARRGEKLAPAARAALEQEIIDRVDAESTALYATARLWDDGVIDPRDSRRVLGLCLRLCKDAGGRALTPSSFGVPRF